MKEKIYLAGPWFTKDQMLVQEEVERMALARGRQIFSPRVELTLTKLSTKADHERCFQLNNQGLRGCGLVLANVEGYDTGTLWEMGAAYAYGTQVVIYSPNPDRKLNVMLAQGCRGFLAGLPAVLDFLTSPNGDGDFNWAALRAWHGEVF